jgi:hypothetical protein
LSPARRCVGLAVPVMSVRRTVTAFFSPIVEAELSSPYWALVTRAFAL